MEDIKLIVYSKVVPYSYRYAAFGDKADILIPPGAVQLCPDSDNLYVFYGYIPLFNSPCVALSNNIMCFVEALSHMAREFDTKLYCNCTVIDKVDSVVHYCVEQLFTVGNKPNVNVLGDGMASVNFVLMQA